VRHIEPIEMPAASTSIKSSSRPPVPVALIVRRPISTSQLIGAVLLHRSLRMG
jgi:hypothetical protein